MIRRGGPYGDVTLIPHSDYRGAYHAGSLPSGAAYSCMPAQPCLYLVWPKKYWGSYWDGGDPANGDWAGSLIRGNQDVSGLMYRRNRNYDPTTGQFTQSDPIGIAGGLNTYGFAAGDPISFSDPFGLNVECKNKEACDMWARVWTQALRASESSNEAVASRGKELVEMMTALVRDDETLINSVQDVGWFNRLRNRGNGTSPCEDGPAICGGRGDFFVVVDPAADHGKNVGADVRFVHELGYAYAYMVLGATSDTQPDNRTHACQSVRAENHYRAGKGCALRGSHHRPSPRNCE